jgi:hypothetical protein
LKLAATVTGAAKGAFGEAARYAVERQQFGRPLAEFGAIREKLADMTAALFAAESLLYRVAGLLDERIATLDRAAPDYYRRYQRAIEDYAGECAIAKVFCTQVLAQVADEGLQIHGGYGYIKDYPIERYYRDERVNRIFEGTNEINRLLIPTLLFRRAESGALALWEAVEAVGQVDPFEGLETTGDHGALHEEFALLGRQKQLFLLLAGRCRGRGEQEILLTLGDMMIAIFALESSLLRAAKGMVAASERKGRLLQAVARVTSFDTGNRFRSAAERCAAYAVPGPELAALQQTIGRLNRYPVNHLLAAKQELAAAGAESGGYPF